PATVAAPPTTAETFDAVSDALDAAAAAWTSGQVDAVMATYVHDEPLLVFLGDTPLKGPDSVRAALDARAAEPGGLGTLSYEWFETMQFDVNTAVVSGRAVMTRGGKTHRGLFTRILRRPVDGWPVAHARLARRPPGSSPLASFSTESVWRARIMRRRVSVALTGSRRPPG